MALDALGVHAQAASLLGWTRHLREDNGGYRTGCVHPSASVTQRRTHRPHRRRCAHHHPRPHGTSRAAALFRGEALLVGITELAEAEEVAEP